MKRPMSEAVASRIGSRLVAGTLHEILCEGRDRETLRRAIVALEDELRVSSYQPLLRAFSTGSGAGNGLGVSRLGRARSRTPLLDEWVEMARRRPDRDAALSTLRAAFGTGPKARRAMRIMVNDIRKAR